MAKAAVQDEQLINHPALQCGEMRLWLEYGDKGYYLK